MTRSARNAMSRSKVPVGASSSGRVLCTTGSEAALAAVTAASLAMRDRQCTIAGGVARHWSVNDRTMSFARWPGAAVCMTTSWPNRVSMADRSALSRPAAAPSVIIAMRIWDVLALPRGEQLSQPGQLHGPPPGRLVTDDAHGRAVGDAPELHDGEHAEPRGAEEGHLAQVDQQFWLRARRP